MGNENKASKGTGFKQFVRVNASEISAFICLAVLLIAATILSEFFWAGNNLVSIGTKLSYYGTAAAGCMLVMILGCIDVSQLSIMAVVVMTIGVMKAAGTNIWLVMLACIGIGLLAGMINGVLVTRFKVLPMIATIGMNFVGRAVAYLIEDNPLTVNDDVIRLIGYKSFWGIPILLWIMIVVAAIIWFISRFTSFGRQVYAIGSNPVVAYLSGIRVTKVKFIAYLISGVTAAIAGIMWVAQLSSAYPSAGAGFELIPIASCVIGGISLDGGKGTLIGTMIGVIIMVVLTNIMTLLSLSSYYQQLCQGLVLIGVLVIRGSVVVRSKKA